MDEADLLSDRIIFIDSGTIKGSGNPVGLKRQYGTGYTVTLQIGNYANRTGISRFFRSHVPEAQLRDDAKSVMSFVLPCTTTSKFEQLFTELDNAHDRLGIINFGVSATTLEEVFLKVTNKADDDVPLLVEPDNGAVPSSGIGGTERAAAVGTDSNRSYSGPMRMDIRDNDEPDSALLLASISSPKPSRLMCSESRQKSYGTSTYTSLLASRAVFTKRFHNTRRDPRTCCVQVVVPVIFVCMAMLVASLYPPVGDQPPRRMSPRAIQTVCGIGHAHPIVPITNMTGNMVDTFDNAFQTSLSEVKFVRVRFKNMSSYLLGRSDDSKVHGGLSIDSPCDLCLPSTSGSDNHASWTRDVVYRTWYDPRYYHTLPGYLNLLNNAFLAQAGAHSASIETIDHPMPVKRKWVAHLEQRSNSATDLTVAIFILIAFSFVPASSLIFLVAERASGFKHLQFASGMTAGPFWAANYLFDTALCSLSVVLALIVFVSFDLDAYAGRNLAASAAILCTYVMAMSPLMYPFSVVFNTPSTAFVGVAVGALFIGLSTTISTTILDIVERKDPNLKDTNDGLKIIFLIFPNYNLGRGLIEIAKNENEYQMEAARADIAGDDPPNFRTALRWDCAGKHVITNVGLAVLYLGGMCLCQAYATSMRDAILKMGRHFLQFMTRKKNTSWKQGILSAFGAYEMPIHTETDSDSDVEDEQRSISSELGSDPEKFVAESGLVLHRLRKRYQVSRTSSKLAVQHVSVRVNRGECFGLLGVNGAGKTTTFKMLTGELRPSCGDVFICGRNLCEDRRAIQRLLGYCPQFDALAALMTPREHLLMFGRIRGLAEPESDSKTRDLLAFMQLDQWADKPAKTLSGGNRRKLCVAIALLSDPPVLLLDEPSTGMDPKARRFLWDCIQRVMDRGCTVVLTTHSMEESEALCSRLAIMVNGKFKCLGSSQHIKSKYGGGYTLTLNCRRTVDNTKLFVRGRFPEAVLDEQHDGYLRYSIPNCSGSIGSIFGALEAANNDAELFEDYALTQTSLEHVFCRFAVEQAEDCAVNDQENHSSSSGADDIDDVAMISL